MQSSSRRVETIDTTCCVVGGGPAGMVAGLLLAGQGVDVLVLEKHADFHRDFRGDTIHPSTLELMHELGWVDELLELPHTKLTHVTVEMAGTSITFADFSRLKVRCPFVAFMPQWDFLDFLARKAKAYPPSQASHPLVGEWLGEHRCEHIVEVLTAAGFETAILENIVGNGLLPGIDSVDESADPIDPCAGAVVVAHSHEFTADGRFASYDASHQQVDDGTFTIVDDDTFAIDRATFTYVVDGDLLTLTPDEPTQWSTMVALPGFVWKRVTE